MKITAALLAVMLGSSSVAQSYFGLKITPRFLPPSISDITESVAARFIVEIVVPADFPNPSVPLEVVLLCDESSLEVEPEVFDQSIPNQFADFVEREPSIKLEANTFTVADVEARCEDERLSIQGPNLKTAIGVLADNPFGVDSLKLGARDSIRLTSEFDYEFPSISRGLYSYGVLLHIEEGRLSAETYTQGNIAIEPDRVVVGIKQGEGSFQPVFFEGRSTPIDFNPENTVQIAVYRGDNARGETFDELSWDYLALDYVQGKFSWWQNTEGPQ